MNYDEILDYPYEFEDAEASCLREYFCNLLLTLWHEGEGFSGKRPFGDSGWKKDVLYCIASQGLFGEELPDPEYDDGDPYQDALYQYVRDNSKKYNALVNHLIGHCSGYEVENGE
jgi:hypothetical protein